MPGIKISAQTAATAKLPTDKLPIARGGVGYGVTNVDTDVTANTGSAYTIDQANGTAFNLTLTAATPTLTLQTAPISGTTIILYVRLIQDGTGGRAPTFSNVTWASGTAPSIAQAIGAVTYLTFAGNGGIWTGFSSLQATDNLTVANLTSTGTQTFTGVSNASSAATGKIGEFIISSLASGSALSLTTTQALDFANITLTAGDWEISGFATVTAGGATVVTTGSVFIGTAAGNNTTGRDTALNNSFTSVGANSSSDNTVIVSPYRVNITSTTTYYIKASFQFSVSTLSVYGKIQARRIR